MGKITGFLEIKRPLAVFIPCAWVPKNLARRSCSTCSGRLGGAAAAGRTMVRSPAAPSPIPL
jgi:hypothetical protein